MKKSLLFLPLLMLCLSGCNFSGGGDGNSNTSGNNSNTSSGQTTSGACHHVYDVLTCEGLPFVDGSSWRFLTNSYRKACSICGEELLGNEGRVRLGPKEDDSHKQQFVSNLENTFNFDLYKKVTIQGTNQLDGTTLYRKNHRWIKDDGFAIEGLNNVDTVLGLGNLNCFGNASEFNLYHYPETESSDEVYLTIFDFDENSETSRAWLNEEEYTESLPFEKYLAFDGEFNLIHYYNSKNNLVEVSYTFSKELDEGENDPKPAENLCKNLIKSALSSQDGLIYYHRDANYTLDKNDTYIYHAKDFVEVWNINDECKYIRNNDGTFKSTYCYSGNNYELNTETENIQSFDDLIPYKTENFNFVSTHIDDFEVVRDDSQLWDAGGRPAETVNDVRFGHANIYLQLFRDKKLYSLEFEWHYPSDSAATANQNKRIVNLRVEDFVNGGWNSYRTESTAINVSGQSESNNFDDRDKSMPSSGKTYGEIYDYLA